MLYATADDVAVIGNKAQKELIDIQVNMPVKRHLEKFGYIDFWKSQGRRLAPTLATVASKDTILPFATTYF